MKNHSLSNSAVSGLVVALVLCTSTAEAVSDTPPDALVRVGEEVGCHVLRDVPVSSHGAVTVWIAAREEGLAYVGWCARESEGRLLYDLLVATPTRKHPWAQCPRYIRLGLLGPFPKMRATMFPEDLPLPKTLNDFWYINETWHTELQIVGGSNIPEGPGLDIRVGGAGQILMCLKGRWIMGGYH